MSEQIYTVEVQRDFLERQTKAQPVKAIAELIWNSLDADATRINVDLEFGELGMTRIVVQDDGHGITYDEAPDLFTRLGGSWKKPGAYTKTKNRMLHGYEGKGRFKVLALGRVADWRVTYRAGDGSLQTYTITLIKDNIRRVKITEKVESTGSPGVEVTVSELNGEYRSLEPKNAIQDLAELFALYLRDYKEVFLCYEGHKIDPNTFILDTRSIDLDRIDESGEKYPVELEIIEWNSLTNRALYLCTEHGFPLLKVPTRFHVGEFNFSAYLRSSFITKQHLAGQLHLSEMMPLLNDRIEDARQAIKEYSRERAAQRAQSLVEEWKAEKIYPFVGEAKTPLEDIERKVFDIVAVTASDYMPDFEKAPQKKKAFDLRMLRTAVEKSPQELQTILKEVLTLPVRKQKELAELLEEASLSSIINAAKIVSDRLKFLTGLEQILFNTDIKNRLKERAHLHKIIEDNTWLFGEEYNLSVSDRGLTAVLKKHQELLGEEIIIDEPVKHISQKRGIIDLMFSRSLRRYRPDDLEHLVIELKRPNIKIDTKAITQVENYAISVAADERFRTVEGVKWTFWAISDDVNKYALFRMGENGVVSSKNNITVGIKTWGQVIEENRARLQFFPGKARTSCRRRNSLKSSKEEI